MPNTPDPQAARSQRYAAELVERTVAVTWPDNDRGGATPPPDGWQARAWEQRTLHEIDEGSVSGCSVLRWRNDPRLDADLIAVSLALVSGAPLPAAPPSAAETTNRAALRDRIGAAVDAVFQRWTVGLGEQRPQDVITDAVLAVLPAQADQAEWDALCREAGRLRKTSAEMVDRAERIEADVQQVRANRATLLREADEEQVDRLAAWLWNNCAEDERTGLLADDPRKIAAVALRWPELRRVAAEEQPAETQAAPPGPGTPRCATCTHPKSDHDGRADHRARFSPLVAGEPWCHACEAPCDYAEQPAETQDGADLPDRLEAVLTERFTELGNPLSEMRRHEQGPDGWPASHPVGPHQVAEVLRELMTAPAVGGAQRDGSLS